MRYIFEEKKIYLIKNTRHNFLNEKFYLRSIIFFKEKKIDKFHIFTDDINYAKKILKKSNINKYILIKNYLNNSIQEFELLNL